MFDGVDVYGFAGAFTLGMVQAGCHLMGKREGSEGFGMENCESNRHLLGYDWIGEACDPRSWTPVPNVSTVFGNPPCSGFSTYSPPSFRGVDSPVNKCMYNLVDYAIRCGGPQMVCFESVQPAYFLGRPLMRTLWQRLRVATGKDYKLYHVLHNAASVGGGSIRRRYFFLASRVPFGIAFPVIKAVPSLFEILGDLRGMRMSWDAQPYVSDPSWWAHPLRSPDGMVDGHTLAYNSSVQRILDLTKEVPWKTNEKMIEVAERYYKKVGNLPESFQPDALERYQRREWNVGFQPRRWDYTRPAKVVMGSGPHSIIHPEEARTMTYREVARIMGWPDTWTLKQCRGNRHASSWFGKGITVQCGSWIGGWIDRAVNGSPGPYGGEQMMEGEYYIDVTNTYRMFPGAHHYNGQN